MPPGARRGFLGWCCSILSSTTKIATSIRNRIGTATGWTHAAETVTSAGPTIVSGNTFSWADGTSTAPTEDVAVKDAANNQSAVRSGTLPSESR